MSHKKIGNQLHFSKSTNPKQLRTLFKNRNNKQTTKDLVHLSTTLQQKIDNDDKKSVRSSYSMSKKTGQQQSTTDKIKRFVRNMKNSKNKQQQPTCIQIPKTIQNRNLTNSRQSIYSVKSNRTSKSNFVSMHIDKDIPDNKSFISNKSMIESDLLSKSKIIFSKSQEDSGKQRMIQKLNRMEQKMEFLMKNKLRNLMVKARSKHRFNPKPFFGARSFNTQIDQNNVHDNLLQKQLQNIIDSISSLKQKDSQLMLTTSELEQNISQLDKKIQLLQKILASNYTQAEILKKYYFSQKSQKCPHLSRKQKIIQQISKRKEMLKNNLSMLQLRELKSKPPIINYQSTSKYFYSKPNQSAYLNPKSNLKPFAVNRQPMPRSTYDRQFLNYGTLPVFNYKPHDSKHSSSKLNVKTSIYQQTFKQKDVQMNQMNYKELDCFKDKFKTGSISFFEMYKNKNAAHIKKKSIQNLGNVKSPQPSKEQKQNKKSIQKAIQTLDNLQKMSRFDTKTRFMSGTQMKREFVWHSQQKQENTSPSKGYGRNEVIKDAKLNNYKASYKMQFLR